MVTYTGDKHMDPFTQLRILYKRKGIPLTPFGWCVVCCFFIFIVYEMYSLAHTKSAKLIVEKESSLQYGNGIGKDVRLDKKAKDESGDEPRKASVSGKIINQLGESGLAGGHVLGKLQDSADVITRVALEKAENVKNEAEVVEEDAQKVEDDINEKMKQARKKVKVEKDDAKNDENKMNEKKKQSRKKEEEVDDPDKEIDNGNIEPASLRPIPHDRRFRPTMDPKEFGGQIVEIKRPDLPDENAKLNDVLPNIAPFVRDDRLVPLAHLENIPKPKPQAIYVNTRRKPKFDQCKKYDMIILVHSQALNSEQRTGIRATWYDSKNYGRFVNQTNLWKVIFIVGRTYDSYDEHVANEADDNNDMIVSDLVESEYEDTRKFIIGTQFIVDTFKDCAPKFVLKTKDNIFLNMISIEGWLQAKFKTAQKLYVGNYLKGDQPIRDWSHPLYVSKEEYAKTFFPDMLKGPVYLFSYDVIEKMTSLYRTKTPIAMEDGYIGILMDAMNVKPRHNEHFWLLGMHGNKCNYLRMFFVQNIKPLDHLRLLKSNRDSRKSKECLKAKHYDFRSGKEMEDENPS